MSETTNRATAATTPEDRAEDAAAISEVLAALYRAWAAGDADEFVADYTEDASVIMPGTYRASREQVRQGMAAGFASVLKGSSVRDRQLGIRFLGRDAAVVVSEAAILFPDGSEAPAVHATWVLERRGDDWLVAGYHNSPVAQAV